jgi:hypothetical protein
MSGTDEMRELLIHLYDSFNTGDPKIWRDAVAEDALGVGSDPDEWWDGGAVVLRIGEAQVQEMGAAHVHVEPGTPKIFEQGDVFWAVDRPSISMPGGTPTPMRFTVIASRRGDRLEIRHFHLSAGVTNEEVLGEELTTA